MTRPPINPGQVDWSGENPGMYLKQQADGPFTTLISYFRVVVSPHGRGHVVVALLEPAALPGGRNAIYTDNPTLASYLVDGFVRFFGAFRGLAGLEALPLRRAWAFARQGDARGEYREVAESDDGQIVLSWSELGEPFMVEYQPAQSATGRHEMFSLFVTAQRAEARVGEARSVGQPVPRDMAGTRSTTAFLAFSETWVRPRE